jgi:hypothetical protein
MNVSYAENGPRTTEPSGRTADDGGVVGVVNVQREQFFEPIAELAVQVHVRDDRKDVDAALQRLTSLTPLTSGHRIVGRKPERKPLGQSRCGLSGEPSGTRTRDPLIKVRPATHATTVTSTQGQVLATAPTTTKVA